MVPWPEGWQNRVRLALLGCDCCGRGLERQVPHFLEQGHDTGLPCAGLACRLCQGMCRATLVVVGLGAGAASS
ncbi:MAG: hypothetical protein QOG31_693 [Thermoplasmata archaeon]|jgi:hypothetical protein|nr:hypothetical protein [Thermoplasmata archaeon]HUR63523.1 hypothetical protein [Candidatus Thermoplasmatota archaeon]